MSVVRVRKWVLSPSIECGQPQIGQKNSEHGGEKVSRVGELV